MIRATVTLDKETIEALKAYTEKSLEAQRAFYRQAQQVYIAYRQHESLLFPRYPVSHLFKRGGWNVPE